MSGLNLIALLGLVVLAALAWLSGGCRRPVAWRSILGSALLMLSMAAIVFLLPPARGLFVWLNDMVLAVLNGGNRGAEFLLGPLAVGPGGTTAGGEPSIGFVLATQVLPAVVFFAAVMAVLYHAGLVQPVVRLFAQLFRRGLSLSGAESLAGASNIFFGVESAVVIRPYLEKMTRSELLTVLTCGMSTVASTTLALYVMLLRDSFPQIAGHLISASILSIPAAALTSKLMLPEAGAPQTMGSVPPLADQRRHGNAFAALSAGAWDGLRLAAGIATLLIAVLGLVGVLDLALRWAGSPVEASLGTALSLELILAWLFTPISWLLGIAPADIPEAARLLGGRLILTEVFAYQQLGELSASGAIGPRSTLVLSYALCGFTHVASVGVFVGGLTALAPSRRNDITALGFRALIGATLATLMTGALASLLYHGQTSLLGL